MTPERDTYHYHTKVGEVWGGILIVSHDYMLDSSSWPVKDTYQYCLGWGWLFFGGILLVNRVVALGVRVSYHVPSCMLLMMTRWSFLVSASPWEKSLLNMLRASFVQLVSSWGMWFKARLPISDFCFLTILLLDSHLLNLDPWLRTYDSFSSLEIQIWPFSKTIISFVVQVLTLPELVNWFDHGLTEQLQ